MDWRRGQAHSGHRMAWRGHLSWPGKIRQGPPSLPQKLERGRALTWPLSPHGQQWLASLVLLASLLCALGQPGFS